MSDTIDRMSFTNAARGDWELVSIEKVSSARSKVRFVSVQSPDNIWETEMSPSQSHLLTVGSLFQLKMVANHWNVTADENSVPIMAGDLT